MLDYGNTDIQYIRYVYLCMEVCRCMDICTCRCIWCILHMYNWEKQLAASSNSYHFLRIYTKAIVWVWVLDSIGLWDVVTISCKPWWQQDKELPSNHIFEIARDLLFGPLHDLFQTVNVPRIRWIDVSNSAKSLVWLEFLFLFPVDKIHVFLGNPWPASMMPVAFLLSWTASKMVTLMPSLQIKPRWLI